LLFAFFAFSLALTMETLGSSEKSVNFHQATWRHNRENNILRVVNCFRSSRHKLFSFQNSTRVMKLVLGLIARYVYSDTVKELQCIMGAIPLKEEN
jgi:hypothetical protein